MDVKTIAVIGAGTMGRGIAYVSALGGYQTLLEDVRPQMLDQAMDWMRQAFAEGVDRGKLTAEDARAALARVRTAGRVDEAADADLVIEAAPEDIELKIELFGMFDKFTRADTILATNTSSLSITEMAAVTQRPDRCVGMHFFNPVPKMKLLELVRALETSDQTLDTCREV